MRAHLPEADQTSALRTYEKGLQCLTFSPGYLGEQGKAGELLPAAFGVEEDVARAMAAHPQ